MITTPNYTLKKIELPDSPPDITVINGNWDTIDTIMKKLNDEKAPLASPVFTGTPTVPTAAIGTNTLQIASTAFVKSAIDNAEVDVMTGSTTEAAGVKGLVPAPNAGTDTRMLSADGTWKEQVTYSHPDSGVTAGTYTSVKVNAQGHVTDGTNPTTLAGYGITDAVKIAAASLATTGYRKYADGFIIQWGTFTGTCTFPVSFPNVCLNVCCASDNEADVNCLISNVSKTGFNTNRTRQNRYIAIGY